MKYLILILLISSFKSFSFERISCPHIDDLNKISLDIIRADLSGVRLTESKESCLNQKSFPYYRVGRVPNNESVSRYTGLVKSMKNVRIKEVKTLSKDTGTHEVVYDLTLTNGKKILDQKIRFLTYPNSKNHWIYGCASAYSYSKGKYLLMKCVQNK